MNALTRTAIALIAGIAASLTWPLASPAQAAAMDVCEWEDRIQYQTYSCREFTDTMTAATIVDCWQYPLSPLTYVRQKTEAGWVRNPQITVETRRAKTCEQTHPYRTLITIPDSQLAEMRPTRVRLVIPASSGRLDDGTRYRYGKTVLTYGVCLVPEGTLEYCPER